MAPRHDALRHLEKLIEAIDRVWWSAAPREGLDRLGGRLRAVDVRASAEHGSRREAGADSSLRVIAKHRSEKLHPRVPHPAWRPEIHRSVRVLQVARDRPRADVHPAAEVRVADESVVA